MARPRRSADSFLNIQFIASATKGPEFLASFMRGVWAEGINAGNDAALKSLAAHAGLDGAFVDAALEDDGWRTIATENRDEMLAAGL